jgi:N-carbamoyl-L-amino-acid hydrolase
VTWDHPLWQSLLPVGRDERSGGYRRSSFDPGCREWFALAAANRGLRAEADRNGNLWAWWGDGPGAVVTGSHLDSVPDGGAFDGPLGVVSAFAAIDRLLTGAVAPDAALALTDPDGVTLAEAFARAGLDPDAIGPDPQRLSGIGAFVELHIEQGRTLGAPVAVAEAIWPHGRWRLDFAGRADHAGTTRIEDRSDPMLAFAAAVLAARDAASESGALATISKVAARPGAVNAINSSVTAWLDARAPDQARLDALVARIAAAAGQCGMRQESSTPRVEFDFRLRDRLRAVLGAPLAATGAGHDAGVLAAVLPTAMLFVRNPTGVSHSPAEHADPADCEAGVLALAAVLEDLAGS